MPVLIYIVRRQCGEQDVLEEEIPNAIHNSPRLHKKRSETEREPGVSFEFFLPNTFRCVASRRAVRVDSDSAVDIEE